MLIDEWETWNPSKASSSLSFLSSTIFKQVALSDADPQAVQAHFRKIHSVSEVKEKIQTREIFLISFLIFFQNTTLLILFPPPTRWCVLPAARWRGGQMLGCSVEPQQETDRVPSKWTAPLAGQDGHCIWVRQPDFEIQHVWSTNVISFINNTMSGGLFTPCLDEVSQPKSGFEMYVF